MWFASLLTSSVASFGRLVTTTLIPTAIPLVFLWTLLRAHSFEGATNWDDVLPASLTSDTLAIILAVVGVAILASILQPFQIRLVRLLEGYWEGWSVTARIAPLFIEFQRRRLSNLKARRATLKELSQQPTPTTANLGEQLAALRLNARTQSELRRVRERINRFPGAPPSIDEPAPLLPTALGNALRVGEITAGERYSLNTITSWPRLYPDLSKKFSDEHDAALDAVDTAANLTVSFALVTLLAVAGFCQEPAYYWIPVLTFALTCLSYTGSVAAALQYGSYLHVAYDLHRFDMLKGLHYPLPADSDAEREIFEKLSEFFRYSALTHERPDHLIGQVQGLPEYKHSN